MKKIGVLTSGGDAPGMNPAIRSVVRCAVDAGMEVYGFIGGYAGLVNKNYVKMSSRDVGNIIYRGGTILKTARCEEFKTEQGMKQSVETIKALGLDSLIVIGGDGSLRGAKELEKRGVNVIFIPCTIDNDVYYSDYSLGFDTACNTIVNLVNNLRDTSESHDLIFIVEVMGAYCGELAINAGLASGAEDVFVPEETPDIDGLLNSIKLSIKKGKKSSIIFVNEHTLDTRELANIICTKLHREVRCVVLGHTQRGGSPSFVDRLNSAKFGREAVDLALGGHTGAIGIKNDKIVLVNFDTALRAKHRYDRSMLSLIRVLAK